MWPWRRTLRGRLPLGLGEKHFDVGKPTAWEVLGPLARPQGKVLPHEKSTEFI